MHAGIHMYMYMYMYNIGQDQALSTPKHQNPAKIRLQDLVITGPGFEPWLGPNVDMAVGLCSKYPPLPIGMGG